MLLPPKCLGKCAAGNVYSDGTVTDGGIANEMVAKLGRVEKVLGVIWGVWVLPEISTESVIHESRGVETSIPFLKKQRNVSDTFAPTRFC